MKQYLDLLKTILTEGEERQDRTGVGTIALFGTSLRFNLRETFPAVTTKRLAFAECKGELIWFLEGSTDERRLAEITYGTRDPARKTIWTPNATADYWKPKAKFDGDLGRVYGAQWRDFGGVDQVTELIKSLKNDPFGRRHIINAWNPAELSQMALPPCHMMSQFYVSRDGHLSCQMYQRSADLFLGVPFNIASYALLTALLAIECGYKPGTLSMIFGDTHVYLNHVKQVEEQLSRMPFDEPLLQVTPSSSIFDVKMTDIALLNYQSHGPIKATMAV